MNSSPDAFDAELDRQIFEALNSVPTPDGLQQRLIENVCEHPRGAADNVTLDAGAQVVIKAEEPARHFSRRNAILLGATTAGVLLIATLFWPTTLSRQALTNMCIRHLEAFESSKEDVQDAERLPGYLLHYLARQARRPPSMSMSFDARPFGKKGKAWSLPTASGPLYIFEFAHCADMTELSNRIARINEPSHCDGWTLLAFRTKSKIVVFASQSNIWELVEKQLFVSA